jgi:hypothetical protein
MSYILRLLSENSGLSEASVRRIMLSAPSRYKIYYIKKRNGGLREIAQPAREVKFLQRIFMDTTLQHLPVHEAATAYRPGASILDNAQRHANAGPILKMDFRNFFPSITSVDWVKYCKKYACLTEHSDIWLTSHLLFKRNRDSGILQLAIGAPSSPMLSNILMFDFDRLIAPLVSQEYVIYTRYADDITFSARRTGYFKNVRKNVVATLKTLDLPKLEVNDEKTTFVTKKFHRQITGLTLANDGQITIGRAKKRLLSAAVHHAVQGRLSVQALQRLSGYLAFVNSVEPQFLDVLRRRYGNDSIMNIQKTVVLGNKIVSKEPGVWVI